MSVSYIIVVKNLSAKQEMQVQALGLEELLEKEMETHSSILAWKRIPPMDRGAWWATSQKAAKSRTQLSDFAFTFHFITYSL